METPIKIFVEGIADQKLIYDYLCHLYGANCIQKQNIISTKGKDNLHSQIQQFQKNTDNEGINLLIFDADDPDFKGTIEKLNQLKSDLNIEFETFLLPNNQDAGDLESLLEKIINTDHEVIFSCWEDYEKCLQNHEKNYTVPAKKTKIYGYLSALLPNSKTQQEKAKERERNYQNSNHWNLKVEYLQPLKQFLDPHFNSSSDENL